MIKKFLKVISEKRFYFQIPKKNNIVLYDKSTEDIFKELKINKKYKVLDKKRLNIYVIFLCFIGLKFSYENYFQTYINLIKPKVVINGVDNDIIFFKLKKKSKICFIAIQNGYRFPSEKEFFSDLIKNEKNLSVDYFFLYNKFFSNYLSKYIKFKPIIHGSIKNNNVPIKPKKKEDIIFISQFNKNKYHFVSYNFLTKKIFSFLNTYCKKKNIKITILFRNPRDSKNFLVEKKFYDNLCNFNYKIFYKKHFNDFKKPYDCVDSADIILTIDSTLGYEALSRKKKVVFFHTRSLGNVKRNFGWPKKIKNLNNNFIPVRLDERYLTKYFEQKINIKYKYWIKKNKKFIKDIILFDFQNKKLINTINQILKNKISKI
tara:strand:+ start:4875 stop:5996 length:1122 start_codon:yes stop_codon:yes gene_type:complete